MNQLTFDDILLNPSVRPEDEERLSRQARRILDLFVGAHRRRMTVTTSQLAAIAAQYNARLYEVRRHLVKRGFCIDLVGRIPGTGVNHYRMVSLADSKFYRQHKERL